MRTLKAMWTMMRSTSDIIVVHDPELLVGAIPIGWVRGRSRVVFDLHENLPAQWPLRTRRRTPGRLRRPTAWIARGVLRVAESAVTVTLAEPGYEVLFRAPHVVFENMPVAGSLPMRAADASGIVYVGDVTAARGAELLVDAVGSLEPPQRLTMIGRCGEDLEASLRAAARESGVDLVMPGFLPYADAWTLAAKSSIAVSPLQDLPNYRDSLPTKVVEYRSVGLVTVVSDLPASLKAIEGSAAARSFVAGDASDLARVLTEAAADADAPERARAEAAIVKDSETWPADRFDAFYRSLIS